MLEPYDIVYADEALCRRWALLMASVKHAGHPLPFADSWIAATVLYHGLPLVTHNPRDFQSIAGLLVISEAPTST